MGSECGSLIVADIARWWSVFSTVPGNVGAGLGSHRSTTRVTTQLLPSPAQTATQVNSALTIRYRPAGTISRASAVCSVSALIEILAHCKNRRTALDSLPLIDHTRGNVADE